MASLHSATQTHEADLRPEWTSAVRSASITVLIRCCSFERLRRNEGQLVCFPCVTIL